MGVMRRVEEVGETFSAKFDEFKGEKGERQLSRFRGGKGFLKIKRDVHCRRDLKRA